MPENRTFRVFVSSTFEDFRPEREALQATFAELQRYCRDRGAHFQAIDLRVGVTHEAAVDQQAMPVCLREVQRCLEITPRPNFIVLVGNRYGWRPLPAEIPAPECGRFPEADRSRLNGWYELDENRLPGGAYVLRSRRGTPEEDDGAWRRTEDELRPVLDRAVLSLAPAERMKYGASATHQEIEAGALSPVLRADDGTGEPQDPRDHVFCFIRDIEGLPEPASAAAYFDTVTQGTEVVLDADASRMLHGLKAALVDRFSGYFDPAAEGHRVVRDALAEALDPETNRARVLQLLRERVQGVSVSLQEEVEEAARGAKPTDRVAADLRRRLEQDGRIEGEALDQAMLLVNHLGLRAILRADLTGILASYPEAMRIAEALLDENEDDDELLLKLHSHLLGNIHRYTVRWGDRFDVERTVFIEALQRDVYEALKRTIDVELRRLDEGDAVEREAALHRAFGVARARHFRGRSDELARISSFVAAPGGGVLAVHGVSGTGKSALMARAFQVVEGNEGSAVLIQRFLGTTAQSSGARELLMSLIREIEFRYGTADPPPVPADYEELVREFPQRLARASRERPLVILLDALDQLSDTDFAHNLRWLPGDAPDEMPGNVAIVVSTLPGEDLDVLTRRGVETLEMGQFAADEADALIDLWLADTARRIDRRQKALVLRRFAEAGGDNALYLRLATEAARSWRSGHEPVLPEIPPPTQDGPNTKEGLSDRANASLLNDLLDRLSSDVNHGGPLVSRVMGYLAAARNGLTEDEMLDLLSKSRLVMARVEADLDTHQPGAPDLERLPVVLWSRLFLDLEPYLTQRGDDGTTLWSFYHRQVRGAAKARYLNGEPDDEPGAENERLTRELARHRELARYFRDDVALVADVAGRRAGNLRKLSELPFQQTRSQLWDDVFETLTDFRFLELKAATGGVESLENGVRTMTYGGVYRLQEDYELALKEMGARGGGLPGDGIPIVTAVDFHRPEDNLLQGVVVRCPVCTEFMPIAEDDLGTVHECPRCNAKMRLNPFVAGKPAWDKR